MGISGVSRAMTAVQQEPVLVKERSLGKNKTFIVEGYKIKTSDKTMTKDQLLSKVEFTDGEMHINDLDDVQITMPKKGGGKLVGQNSDNIKIVGSDYLEDIELENSSNIKIDTRKTLGGKAGHSDKVILTSSENADVTHDISARNIYIETLDHKGDFQSIRPNAHHFITLERGNAGDSLTSKLTEGGKIRFPYFIQNILIADNNFSRHKVTDVALEDELTEPVKFYLGSNTLKDIKENPKQFYAR